MIKNPDKMFQMKFLPNSIGIFHAHNIKILLTDEQMAQHLAICMRANTSSDSVRVSIF